MNERIRGWRGIGLSILKPSKRDLEYGEGLHRNSLVIDAYGNMPLSDYDVEEAVRNRSEFIEAWTASGVTCVFQQASSLSQSD